MHSEEPGTSEHRTCPLCGRPGPAPLRAFDRAHLVRCQGCGFVFAALRPSAAELASHYEGYPRDDYDSPITRVRYRELLDEFEPYRRSNRILDLGCGIGYFLMEARALGWEVHGTEFTDEAIEINRSRGIAMSRAPLRPGDYPPGHFDVVTAFEVVEHLADLPQEAANLARVLRPGGLLYCTTPNWGSLSRRLLGRRWTVVSYPEHLSYFTASTLVRWLEGAGMRPLRVTSTGVSPARLAAALASSGPSVPREQAADPADVQEGPLPSRAKPSLDERLRAAAEGVGVLGAAKHAADRALSAAGWGDTLKGRFVAAPTGPARAPAAAPGASPQRGRGT